jgi:hypothetical protein
MKTAIFILTAMRTSNPTFQTHFAYDETLYIIHILFGALFKRWKRNTKWDLIYMRKWSANYRYYSSLQEVLIVAEDVWAFGKSTVRAKY